MKTFAYSRVFQRLRGVGLREGRATGQHEPALGPAQLLRDAVDRVLERHRAPRKWRAQKRGWVSSPRAERVTCSSGSPHAPAWNVTV